MLKKKIFKVVTCFLALSMLATTTVFASQSFQSTYDIKSTKHNRGYLDSRNIVTTKSKSNVVISILPTQWEAGVVDVTLARWNGVLNAWVAQGISQASYQTQLRTLSFTGGSKGTHMLRFMNRKTGDGLRNRGNIFVAWD